MAEKQRCDWEISTCLLFERNSVPISQEDPRTTFRQGHLEKTLTIAFASSNISSKQASSANDEISTPTNKILAEANAAKIPHLADQTRQGPLQRTISKRCQSVNFFTFHGQTPSAFPFCLSRKESLQAGLVAITK